MDAPLAYTWWSFKQHLSRREIEKMKKNMKKVPLIKTKSDIYHNKEVDEAEKLLTQITNETK